jgi:L-threonylcarbamoyladenylate synthase
MSDVVKNSWAEAENILNNMGIGVIPTDTIYGIVGSALKPTVVEKIYEIRKRRKEKPMIVLISSINDLELFEIKLEEDIKRRLLQIWPNPVSIILPSDSEKFSYLHRGTNSIAFRIPDNSLLIALLKKTGPLVAPSANLEGEDPSKTIDEAKKYFGDKVNFYIDGGNLKSSYSTLVKLSGNNLEVLRQGEYKLPDNL